MLLHKLYILLLLFILCTTMCNKLKNIGSEILLFRLTEVKQIMKQNIIIISFNKFRGTFRTHLVIDKYI